MAIKIRLTRGGSKKRPFYRVVAADSRMPRDGRFIEKLGTYSPLLPKDDPNRVDLNIDKINEWLKKGAQVSDRISRLLENLSVLEPKKRDNPKKGKKHKATLERETAKSEKESNNQKEVSSEEVLSSSLSRISEVNSKINAVIEVFEDAVMHPEKNRMNTNARFSGVPIMIKDMGSRMKGRNQEIGFPWREDYISPCDDPLIENLRDSGQGIET